jgi:peptidoglycan/LPS O-acetylase OafA/YrhL
MFLFGFGYLGVNLFFVVSGLCIHLPQAMKFHAAGSDNLSLKKFAKRRFWRLYPAYFASLIWTSLVLILFPLAIHLVRRNSFNILITADFSSFLSNAFFLQQLNTRSLLFNGVYWTLVYEVQFYLFYPVLLWICRKYGFVVPLIVLFGIEIALAAKPVPIPLFFLGRYYEWFVGMYLAERIASRRPIKIPVFAFPVLLGLSVACVFHSFSWTYRDVLASTAFAALLATCLKHESSWTLLSQPKLVFVGIFSYSLYLIHIPTIDLFWISIGVVHKYVPSVPQWIAFLSIPASYLLAYVFYLWFEKPFLRANKNGEAPSLGKR